MLHIQAERTSKQKFLLQAQFSQYQARSQVFRFGEKIHFYGERF